MGTHITHVVMIKHVTLKKEHICNEQMALRHIQHNYCHQQGQDNGAQCLTCSQIQSVCWVKAIIG